MEDMIWVCLCLELVSLLWWFDEGTPTGNPFVFLGAPSKTQPNRGFLFPETAFKRETNA